MIVAIIPARGNSKRILKKNIKIFLDKPIISYSIKAAKIVKGQLIGVDFLPAKDREKEHPYILEVNASPGFGAIERTTKGNLTQDIFKHFMDRKYWK